MEGLLKGDWAGLGLRLGGGSRGLGGKGWPFFFGAWK